MNKKYAATLIALFVILVLSVTTRPFINGDTSNQRGDSPSSTPQQSENTADVIGFLTLGVIAFQAWIYRQQRDLMAGQLRATETAANAALAALDRPWLVVEIIGDNELTWLNGDQELHANFKIANYGKAPAVIKSLKIVHFRGPDHHNGRPPFDLPSDVLDFPGTAELIGFVHQRGHMPKFLGQIRQIGKTKIIVRDPMREASGDFVIGAEGKTDTFCAVGYRKMEKLDGPGLNPMGVTESYLLGWIFYEILGQNAEIISFCYHKTRGRNFTLYRDYPPYNERKQAKSGQ